MEPSTTYLSTATQTWIDAQKVCVIGAGTMGSGIAAHLSNLGFEVTLLDMTFDSVEQAFQRARKVRPSHFYQPANADAIRLGSIRENLDWVREADWVCEAIVEDPFAKQDLYRQIEPLLREDAMISTNTSGLEIDKLAAGRSESFRRRFLGTHFFNPPRYLKLLELIPTQETDPSAIEAMTHFLESRVGRRVVLAKDTPGFIANRFGMWSMFHAVHTAEKLQFQVEQVDAITGPFLGRPRSGSFRLNDIVGLDVMQAIAKNLLQRRPEDPFIGALRTPTSMQTLLERGWIGAKAGQGYYKKEGRELLALDLRTLAYRQASDAQFDSIAALGKLPLAERLRQASQGLDEVGEFLREHLFPVLRYAYALREEISHNVLDFDRVMQWGFGWQMGPFEMIDVLGGERIGLETPPFYQNRKMLAFSGDYQPLPDEPEYRTAKDFPVIETREGFTVRDMGDGVGLLCLTTKMGTLNPELTRELTAYLKSTPTQRFVLTGDGRCFSVGFDLNYFLTKIQEERWEEIDETLTALQKLGEALEEKSVVAAIFGYALGGGLELALSCSRILADPECKIGLPESRVGLIPAARGTTLMRLHHQDSIKHLTDAAMAVTLGTTSQSAAEAKSLGYLRETDLIAVHPDRLMETAKTLALQAEPVRRPAWQEAHGPLTGMIDRAQDERKRKGEMSEYDEKIGDKIKAIFGKTDSYEDALARERSEFLNLCHSSLTLSRIKHMLETGKPLHN